MSDLYSPSEFSASAESLWNHLEIVGSGFKHFQIGQFPDSSGNAAESQLVTIHVETLQKHALGQILDEIGENDRNVIL